VLSGLDTHKFTFESDIPDLKDERVIFFNSLKKEYKTMIFFTTEHGCNTVDALEDMSVSFGKNRLASISIGLTHENEKTFRGTIGQLYETFKNMKYEFNQVIVVDGYRP
jgi:16S rRNA (cytidine1402-2'-O)-methyltransferase